MWGRSRGIFADRPVELTDAQLRSAQAKARRAARQARGSLRTARGLYRDYRESAKQAYLDWPRWRAAYLREYRHDSGGGPSTAESLSD